METNALSHSRSHLGRPVKVFLTLARGVFLAALAAGIFYWFENFSGRKAWEQYVRESDGWVEGIESEKFAIPQIRIRNYIWLKDLLPPPVDETKNFANYSLWKVIFDGELLHEGKVIGQWIPTCQVKFDFSNFEGPNLEKMRRADLLQVMNLELEKSRTKLGKQTQPLQNQKDAAVLILKLLEPGVKAEEDLRQYLHEHPLCRYPVHRNVDEVNYEFLHRLKDFINYSRVRSCALLLSDRHEEALEEIFWMMDLADTLSREPDLIEIQTKITFYHQTLDLIWEGIESQAWSEDVLVRLQTRLEQTDFWNDLGLGWMGARAFVNQYFSADVTRMNWRELPCGDKEWIGIPWRRLRPMGWYYRQLLEYNLLMDTFLETMNQEERIYDATPLREALKTLDYYLDPKSAAKNPWLIRQLSPSEVPFLVKVSYGQFLVQAAQIACALERYHLKNGRYPSSLKALGQLLPEEELPHDWVNDKAPQIRLTEEGYLLWNNGWNRTDDAGKRGSCLNHTKTDESVAFGFLDISYGDWVWEIKH